MENMNLRYPRWDSFLSVTHIQYSNRLIYPLKLCRMLQFISARKAPQLTCKDNCEMLNSWGIPKGDGSALQFTIVKISRWTENSYHHFKKLA